MARPLAIIRRGKIYYIKYRTPAGMQKWESGFPNRSQAQQRLNQLLGEITHGSYVEPKSTKFEKFAEEWLESRVAVRGSTPPILRFPSLPLSHSPFRKNEPVRNWLRPGPELRERSCQRSIR